MIAISGFGKNYPILIYIWEKNGELSAKDLDKIR
jgi:hypothetical protein